MLKTIKKEAFKMRLGYAANRHPKDNKAMTGIQYVTDEKGRKVPFRSI